MSARRGTRGRAAVGLAAALAGGLILSACSSSKSTAPTTTTTAAGSATLPAITKAVEAYQRAQGIPKSQYQINSIAVSTVDPTWARFAVGPTVADKATFQGGYGYLDLRSGVWRVVGFGSAEVGCPLTGSTTPAAVTYVTVPPAVLAGFGDNCPPTPTSSTSTSSTSSTTSTTTATTTTTSATVSITRVVNAYESAQGIQPSQFVINGITVSSVDPTWAKFSIGPTAADQASFQGGYGFVHQSGGVWTVTGFGTAEVGCPPAAAGNVVVPAAVLAGFNLSCPPS